jgi:hypothetical protein
MMANFIGVLTLSSSLEPMNLISPKTTGRESFLPNQSTDALRTCRQKSEKRKKTLFPTLVWVVDITSGDEIPFVMSRKCPEMTLFCELS